MPLLVSCIPVVQHPCYDTTSVLVQVQHSSVLARQKLQDSFAELRKSINEALDTRLSLLDTQITQLTSDARRPLVKDEEVVKEHNRTATAILDDGLYVARVLLYYENIVQSDKNPYWYLIVFLINPMVLMTVICLFILEWRLIAWDGRTDCVQVKSNVIMTYHCSR